jgi:hypothetical protein
MADLTRTGTDLKGVSDPGAAVKPANDYFSRNITMAVDVQKGQLVAENTSGLGVLADADSATTMKVVGVATEKKKAGERVACVVRGLMAGYTWTGGAVGDLVFASGTAGALADAAGTVTYVVGRRTGLGLLYVDITLAAGGSGGGGSFSQASDVGALSTADAATQGGTYAQVDVQTIATLANALKTKVNLIRTNLRAAGIMA